MASSDIGKLAALTAFWIVVAMSLCFGGFIALGVFREYKTNRERLAGLKRIGFKRVQSPDAAFAASIAELYSDLALSDVYERSDAEGTFYMFDLVGEESSAKGLVALVADRLNLPHLVICPPMFGKGSMGTLMQRWVDLWDPSDLKEIEGVSDTHKVYTDDVTHTLQLVARVGNQLSHLPRYLAVRAQGNIVVLSQTVPARGQSQSDIPQSLIDKAQALASAMQE